MEVVSCLGFFITILILLNHFLHHFWTRCGVEQLSPKFFVGDIGDLFKLKESIAEIYGKLYENSKKSRFVGIYFTYRPALLINDPMLVQNILVKDFSHFIDHGLYVDEKKDPLSGHLFSLSGDKWKNLRAKLSPLFSPGKLKMMFPTFLDCATNLQSFVGECAKGGQVIEIRDLFARYTTDVIASVAFGYENDSINNPENIFRVMGAKVFKPTLKTGLRALTTFLMPQLNMFLGIRVADRDVEEFMFEMVRKTIEHREQNEYQRNDFMQVRYCVTIKIWDKFETFISQMMIKLKNGGLLDVDEQHASQDSRLTLNEVVAQAFVFFIGAFESTSATMALCLYEVTKNQELHQQLQREIAQVVKRHGRDALSYEMLTDLKLLDCCISETLRKYPPAPFLIRECTKRYHVPKSSLIIEKGTSVIISSFGMHRDPNIFQDPLTFKPERFLESSTGSGKGQGLFYMPFGDGPRMCIGMRMGKMTVKIGLFLLLLKFNFNFADETPDKELKFSPKQFVLTLEDELYMRVSLRA